VDFTLGFKNQNPDLKWWRFSCVGSPEAVLLQKMIADTLIALRPNSKAGTPTVGVKVVDRSGLMAIAEYLESLPSSNNTNCADGVRHA